jgi:putative ABC transport system permease protein
MRQRALSTTLTLLSVALGMALAVAIYMVSRESRNVLAQTDYGYELVVGPKGSGTELILSTVYHIEEPTAKIPYALYEDFVGGKAESAFDPKLANQFRGRIQWAVPVAMGDSYKNHPIVATTPAMFDVFEYRIGRRLMFADGKPFAPGKFEAVIGAQAAKNTGLKVGSEFRAAHGFPAQGGAADVHSETWKVVGVLAPTNTASDRLIFITLPSFYAIYQHEAGQEQSAKIREQAGIVIHETQPQDDHDHDHTDTHGFKADAEGNITPHLPKNKWELSAIFVKTKSPFALENITTTLRERPEALAVSPAITMQKFFDQVLSNIVRILLLASSLVVVVAAISILVSIYSAVTSRAREIAILRALGATRRRIMAVTCLEAGLVGLSGAILGLVGGHLIGAIASSYLAGATGQGFEWWHVDIYECLGILIVFALSLLAGLVPAIKAYAVPVAENLTT